MKDYLITDDRRAYNAALITLVKQGFEISIEPPSFDDPSEDDGAEIGFWVAEKDGFRFVASEPVALLGIASIYINRGPNWKRQNDKNYYDEILQKHYPE